MSRIAQQVKDFYNNNFYDGDLPVVAELAISFTDKHGNSIQMNGVRAMAGHTLDQVFRAWHEFALKNEEAPGESVQPVQADRKKVEIPLDVDVFEHRNNRYSVLKLKNGDVVVKNIDKNTVISEKSPTYKTILGLYQNQEEAG